MVVLSVYFNDAVLVVSSDSRQQSAHIFQTIGGQDMSAEFHNQDDMVDQLKDTVAT